MKRAILLIGGAGYIGSYLLPRLQDDGFNVDVCDIGLRGYPHGAVRYACDCAALDRHALERYSHILWFAGHSSVGAAISDPQGALQNNCLNLVTLRANAPASARIIYASSASLYSTALSKRNDDPPWSKETQDLIVNINAYDMSKFVFDYIAQGFLQNFVGLRLGTVSGWSPNLRKELLFNAMNLAAMTDGRVCLANPLAFRSILFLDDLYKVVSACIETPDLEDGFFNVASVTGAMSEFATAIAGHHGAALEALPASPTYSFRLDTSKVEERLNIRFNGDLGQRCQQFAEGVRSGHAIQRANAGREREESYALSGL
jgi:UDP-glucose 4-epimerase